MNVLILLAQLAGLAWVLRLAYLTRRYRDRARAAAARAQTTADLMEYEHEQRGALPATELGRCGYPMAKGDLPTVRCNLVPRHTGDHCVAWTDLVTAGYTPPF